jgi:hypothetical protein
MRGFSYCDGASLPSVRRSALTGLAVVVVAFLLVSNLQAANADAYNLSGTRINKGESAGTLIVKQAGTAITWQATANNKLWTQSFSGVLKASHIKGSFTENEPSGTPKRYTGTIEIYIIDGCHFIFSTVHIPSNRLAAAGNLLNLIFTKTPCTNSAPAPSPTEGLRARILSSSCDVEYRHGNPGSFTKLKPGVVLDKGDYIATGPGSAITLDLGYGTLRVSSITQLRLDEFVDPASLGKTQMFLQVGSVEARTIEHTNSIRSDFGVRTAIVSASIRGSDMIVTQKKNGTATVYTACDVSYVQGSADKKSITLRQGYMTTIGANHHASKPKKSSQVHLPC